MAITKETYRAVLEEGLNAHGQLLSIVDKLRDAYDSYGRGLINGGQLAAMVCNLGETNVAPMLESGVEYKLLMKRWKVLEREKKKQKMRRDRNVSQGLTAVGAVKGKGAIVDEVYRGEKDFLGEDEEEIGMAMKKREEEIKDWKENVKGGGKEGGENSNAVKVDEIEQELLIGTQWRVKARAEKVAQAWYESDTEGRSGIVQESKEEKGFWECVGFQDGQEIGRINLTTVKNAGKRERKFEIAGGKGEN